MNHKVLFNGDGSMLFRFEGLGDMVPLAEFEKLTAERDAALAQNAELVAQVETLKQCIKDWCGTLRYQSVAGSYVQFSEKQQAAINSTPTQCLRDVKAEAGRDGFVAGYLRAIHWPTSCDENHAGYNADQYAARVKAGLE